jgi:GT2 family glycosyltransferase
MSTFSVIIPTYQRPEELAGCLDCLAPGTLELSFDDYEVIVSDDAGTGSETQRLVAEQYPWATWVEGPGRGAAANRNEGASHAQSEWLVFTDDDCRPQPGWLKAYSDVNRTATLDIMEGKTTADREKTEPGWTAPINREGGVLWSCNFAIRRMLYHRIKGFDENYLSAGVEDIDFRIRAFEASNKRCFVSDAHVLHPWRKVKSLSEQISELRSWAYFFQKFPEQAEQYNVKYHLGGLLDLLKWVPHAARGEGWRREVGLKIKRVLKSVLILYWQVKDGHKQQP